MDQSSGAEQFTLDPLHDLALGRPGQWKVVAERPPSCR